MIERLYFCAISEYIGCVIKRDVCSDANNYISLTRNRYSMYRGIVSNTKQTNTRTYLYARKLIGGIPDDTFDLGANGFNFFRFFFVKV